jgi:DNA-binding transcriptional MerR regulator
MKTADEVPAAALQLFEPQPDEVYTIETVAHLAQVSRRMILVYYKYGLVTPIGDPERGGYYFNSRAIRALRRIAYLQSDCGLNIAGIKMFLALTREIERLRAQAPRSR